MQVRHKGASSSETMSEKCVWNSPRLCFLTILFSLSVQKVWVLNLQQRLILPCTTKGISGKYFFMKGDHFLLATSNALVLGSGCDPEILHCSPTLLPQPRHLLALPLWFLQPWALRSCLPWTFNSQFAQLLVQIQLLLPLLTWTL